MVTTNADCTLPALRSTFKPKMYHSQAKAVRDRLGRLMKHMIARTMNAVSPMFVAWIGETVLVSEGWSSRTTFVPAAVDAEFFLAEAGPALSRLWIQESQANWIAQTHIAPGTEALQPVG